MITREMLMAALERLEPWHWKATDWRKLSNWRIVRFVKWNWRAEERKCNRWGGKDFRAGFRANGQTKGKY